MADFTIQIAGRSVKVHSLFESTRDYCRSYLTEEVPEYDITVSREDLAFEQEFLRQEAIEEGIKIRTFTDPFLDRAAIQRKVADHLLRSQVLLFHGSAVALDGKGYLFTADCGTGKSTHTRFWREVFGSEAIMINDDKPFLRITDDGILACGSPWSGKHGLASNVCVPLKGICLLHRGSENLIERIEPNGIIDMLYNQAHSPDDVSLMQKTRSLVDRLAQMVPLWEMECNKDLDAAKVAYCAMSSEFD